MSRRRSRSLETTAPLDLASAALLVAIVSTPAYFNIQSSASFEPDKGGLLRSLATVALVYLVLELVKRLREGYRPSWSQFSLPPKLLAAFVLVILVSTIAGVDPLTSLWGNYERGYGLLSLLATIMVGIIAYGMARSDQHWLLIDAILLAAVVPMVYGLLQVIGYDPVIGQTVSFDLGQRASSSLGNPLFLADFLLIVIPLGLARLVLNTPRSAIARVGLGVYLILLVLTLVATKSLTALGASITAGAVFLTALGKLQQRRGFTVGGLLVLAGGLVLLLLAWIIPDVLPWRLGDIFASGGSGGQRLLTWQAVVDLMRDQPRWLLTGLGPDVLSLKIATYLPAEIAHFEVDWAFRLPDRVHTWPLDLLSMGGVLALVLWLLFWIAVMAKLLPAFPKRGWLSVLLPAGGALLGAVLGAVIAGLAALPIGLMAGLLGGVILVLLLAPAPASETSSGLPDLSPYLLAALVGHWLLLTFSFSTHAPDLLLWCIVGLALGSGLAPARAATDARKRQQPEPRPHFLLAGIACAIFTFSISAAWPAALPLGLASLLSLVIVAWLLSGFHDNWYVLFIPILTLSPAFLLNQLSGSSAWLAYTWVLIWLLAMTWLLLPAVFRRRNLFVLLALIPILILLNLPVYGDIAYKSALLNSDPETRTEHLKRGLRLSPHDHVMLLGIAYMEGQLQAPMATLEQPRSQYVSQLYQRAQQAQPLALEAPSAYGEWLRLLAEIDQKAVPPALESFNRALEIAPSDIETRNRLALLRWQSGNVEGAINDLVALLAVDPLYGPTYLNLATIQKNQGDLDAARATLQAGVTHVPWWPELQNALDRLQ